MFNIFVLDRKRRKSYVVIVNEDAGTAWCSPPLKRKDANFLFDGIYDDYFEIR